MKDKLKIAKKIIKKNFHTHQCGLFDTRNIMGDEMRKIYNKNGLIIDVCDYWAYFEVFGLSNNDFRELTNYYNELKGAGTA